MSDQAMVEHKVCIDLPGEPVDGNVPTREPRHFAAEDGKIPCVSLVAEGKGELRGIDFGSLTAVRPQRVGD